MAPAFPSIHRTRPRTRHRNPLATALMAALTLAMLVLPAAAAQAHDVLEGTNPTDGSTVAAVPATIQMTYNNTPIAIGSEILVKDASGNNWASGPVDIIDNHVSQDVKAGAPAGKYTVEWRIVSSDSHPIEGTFSFTAKGSAGAATATDEAIQSTQAEPGTSTVATDSGGVPWSVIGLGAVGLVLVVALLWGAKRRLNQTDVD